MKKIFLLFLTGLLVISADAQTKNASTAQKTAVVKKVDNPKFEVFRFTFKNNATFTTGTEKEYVIYEIEGWKQQDLYNAMLIGLSKLFKNPDKTITKVENELITVNGVTDYCINYSGLKFAFTYTVKFLFKDGKIRCETPIVNAFVPVNDTPRSNVAGWIRTQDNYSEVKTDFEYGICKEIYNFLTKSFDKEETDW